jgi:MFS superfamily sulfate permease-like transporter
MKSETLHRSLSFTAVKDDFFASLVVFLVALPLSLGLALVAGYPFEKAAAVGLLSSAIGGIVVGFFSGSPLQVSGAANGAAITIAAFASEFGFKTTSLIIVLAGGIQIIAGLLRFGPICRAISPALVQGMLAGIGLLILASQFHIMVDDLPPGSGREFSGVINLWSLPEAIWKGLYFSVHQTAALLGLLTISLILFWNNFAPKSMKSIPAALIGVGIATFTAELFDLDVKYVPAPDQLSEAISLISLSSFVELSKGPIWMAALTLAFVTSAESLLTASAIDALQKHASRSKYNQELIAQGLGNVICGVIGVLPISGVIVRSAANVNAGAKTRLSTILHGAWIIIFIVYFPDILRNIPVASLAAVLVYAGATLIKINFIKDLWRMDRVEALVYAVTMGTVVATDVLTGIALGVILALIRLIYQFSFLQIIVKDNLDINSVDIYLVGAATFIRLPQIIEIFENINNRQTINIYLSELNYIDHACLDMLMNWHKNKSSDLINIHIDWAKLDSIFRKTVPSQSLENKEDHSFNAVMVNN